MYAYFSLSGFCICYFQLCFEFHSRFTRRNAWKSQYPPSTYLNNDGCNIFVLLLSSINKSWFGHFGDTRGTRGLDPEPFIHQTVGDDYEIVRRCKEYNEMLMRYISWLMKEPWLSWDKLMGYNSDNSLNQSIDHVQPSLTVNRHSQPF